MIAAARSGALHLDKLEAMTCVCSVGLDMIAVPGDTTAATLSAIIADEAAIGMVNSKTTAVRLIPAPGKVVGDTVEFGGLLAPPPSCPSTPRAVTLCGPRRPHPCPHAESQELTRPPNPRCPSPRPACAGRIFLLQNFQNPPRKAACFGVYWEPGQALF